MSIHANTLPNPPADQLAQSQQLVDKIIQQIDQNGPMPFDAFMSMALYNPQYGYYQQKNPFNREGDFITSAHCGPWFSQMLAKQIEQVAKHLPSYNLCEIGAGDGTMALNTLLSLASSDALPDHYFIIEKSTRLQQVQKDCFKQSPHLLKKITWLEQLPDDFTGIIFANEVLDAMPFKQFKKLDSPNYVELFVSHNDGQLIESWQPTQQQLPPWVGELNLEAGHVFEINLHTHDWLLNFYKQSKQAILLLIDYGCEESAYFSRSKTGYARAFYKHHVHGNCLLWPGLQDITTHVNFTATAQAAFDIGWSIEGYTSQANFLMDCGIQHTELPAYDSPQGIEARAQIKQLMLPQDMGEMFKVLALSKHCDLDLIGFQNEFSYKL